MTTPPAEPALTLTRGLGRNAVFNVIGWAVPVVLYLITTPLIVHGVGAEAFGVFGIVSLAAGYLAFLVSSSAVGNVRFLAESFGRRNWQDFRNIVLAALALSAAIGAVAGAILFALAPFAPRLFKIPPTLAGDAVVGIRLAGLGFFVNSIVGALSGVPTAVRRYDLVNGINLLAGVVSTVGVAIAVQRGGGLLSAVSVQVLSSVVALIGFALIAQHTVRKLGGEGGARLDRSVFGKLFSFSVMLSIGQIGTTIGLQMDRTVVAALMGPAAVTFYTVPSRIADQVTGFLGKLTTALYPLAAEGSGADRQDEIRRLYMVANRAVVWLSVILAVPIVALAHDILLIWMGSEFAEKSAIVLGALAVAAIFRASTAVSVPVCTGLGRADASMIVGWAVCISYSIPVFLLARRYGINGAAIGCVVGIAPLAFFFDAFVQRRLLGQKDWAATVFVYAKPIMSGIIALAILSAVPFETLQPWAGRIGKLLLSVGICVLACVAFERRLIAQVLRHVRSQRAQPSIT